METKSKITNRERIVRLVKRMCNAKMNIIIKVDKGSSASIRGVLRDVGQVKGKWLVSLGDISQRGREILAGSKSARVEVLGMPSQVTFISLMVRKHKEGVFVTLPKSLTSVERRQNIRHPTVLDHMAYFKAKGYEPTVQDVAAPPIISGRTDLASWISLSDLSLGGACLLTRFKSVVDHIKLAGDLMEGQLILPMTEPISCRVFVRWQKKTTNRLVSEGEERALIEYRVGIEFDGLSEEQVVKVRQFMRRLSMAQAI